MHGPQPIHSILKAGGGPAFPTRHGKDVAGLTAHHYFCAHVLQGLISARPLLFLGGATDAEIDELVETAYKISDRLIHYIADRADEA